MNKNLPLIGGGVLILAIIGYLVIFNAEPDRSDFEKIPESEKASLLKEDSKAVAIAYEKTAASPKSQAIGATIPVQANAPKIETLAGKYRISIVDTTNKTYTSGGYVKVSGTIDKEAFTLRIPKGMIDNYHDGIELQVYNASTKTTQNAPASFIASMTSDSGTIQDSIDINPDDISHVNHEQKNSILPIP
jgi:hypothetical protein